MFASSAMKCSQYPYTLLFHETGSKISPVPSIQEFSMNHGFMVFAKHARLNPSADALL